MACGEQPVLLRWGGPPGIVPLLHSLTLECKRLDKGSVIRAALSDSSGKG